LAAVAEATSASAAALALARRLPARKKHRSLACAGRSASAFFLILWKGLALAIAMRGCLSRGRPMEGLVDNA
jgi:hypothetical protein